MESNILGRRLSHKNLIAREAESRQKRMIERIRELSAIKRADEAIQDQTSLGPERLQNLGSNATQRHIEQPQSAE
ncbi:MAG TPA: hypothetical protein VFN31_00280 [Candidatus Saccharimonadales bacterium]|nr:hypothetical protein [Candidatus Saccharimonadales bacterium]